MKEGKLPANFLSRQRVTNKKLQRCLPLICIKDETCLSTYRRENDTQSLTVGSYLNAAHIAN